MTKSERIGLEGFRIAEPLMSTWGKLIDTNTMKNPEIRQRSIGDYFVLTPEPPSFFTELKTEEEWKHSFFLEHWSNRTPDKNYRRLGWLETLSTDLLVYVFLQGPRLYTFNFPELQSWALHEMDLKNVQVRQAGMSERGEQKNLTWGFCVMEHQLAAVPKIEMTEYKLRDGVWIPASTELAAPSKPVQLPPLDSPSLFDGGDGGINAIRR